MTRSVRFHLVVLAAAGALTWVAWFSHSGSFGLYEDDYAAMSAVVERPLSALPAVLEEAAGGRWSDGRPLHYAAICLLSAAGARLGGLDGAYAVGTLVVLANVALLYLLVLRAWGNRTVAVAAALLFALFPADTTRPLLRHSLGVQPALLLVLVALHLYQSGRRAASHLAGALSLLCYEPFFPLLAAAPYLTGRRPTSKRVLTHLAVMAAVFVPLAIGRLAGGERRAAAMTIRELALAVVNPLAGPVASLGLFAYRPLEGLRELAALGIEIALLPLAAAVAAWLLLRAAGDAAPAGRAVLVDGPLLRLEAPAGLAGLGRIAGTGLALLVLAYPLTMSVPAVAFAGRATRVHAAAGPGACILLARLVAAMLAVARSGRARALVALGAGGFCALLLAAALGVQRDYVTSWSQQRAFWRQVVALCPDVGEGTVVLAETVGLPGARPTGEVDVLALLALPQIRTFSWAMPLVMVQLWEVPQGWTRPPLLLQLVPGWRELAATAGGRVLLTRAWIESLRVLPAGTPLDDGTVILLQAADGKLVRRTGTLELGGGTVRLKDPDPAAAPPGRPRLLHRLLLSDSRS